MKLPPMVGAMSVESCSLPVQSSLFHTAATWPPMLSSESKSPDESRKSPDTYCSHWHCTKVTSVCQTSLLLTLGACWDCAEERKATVLRSQIGDQTSKSHRERHKHPQGDSKGGDSAELGHWAGSYAAEGRTCFKFFLGLALPPQQRFH